MTQKLNFVIHTHVQVHYVHIQQVSTSTLIPAQVVDYPMS